MCINQATPNFLLVEVLIDGAKTTYSLKDEEILRTAKKIIAIETYKVDNVSISPTGRPLANNSVFAKGFLVLQSATNTEMINELPFPSMDRTTNNGRLFYVNIPPIAPSKCFIRVGTTAGIVTGESFLIGFHYEK